MTDKELAKEYVDKLYAEKVSKEDYDKDGWILYRSDDISDAFLDGLKVGRPKWHKVAAGDLPPEDTDVLALLADKEIYMAHFYRRNVWDKIGPVIAWCEIPQYTED